MPDVSAMPNNETCLTMISHGTDGSDSMEAGIHLRWSFNPKMGFPRHGFKLYRRVSPGANSGGSLINFKGIGSGYINIPYTYPFTAGNLNYNAVIKTSQNILNIVELNYSGSKIPAIPAETPVDISFSCYIRQIELDLFLVDGGEGQITAKSDGKIVETGLAPVNHGPETVKLSAEDVNGLSIVGKRLYICEIRFFVSEDFTSGWEGPINEKYGFDLPINITPEYIYDLIRKKSDILPPGKWTIEDIRKLGDLDWVVAASRIPQKARRKYAGKPFEELKAILKIMNDGTANTPVGWRLLDHEDDNTAAGTNEPPANFSVPAVDLALLMSIDPNIAKMLGLYWTDKDAVTGVSYDYRIEADWPENIPWTPDKCLDFEDEQEGRRFGGVFSKDGVVFKTPGAGTIRNKPFALTESRLGLRFLLADGPIEIHFTEPVREVLMYVSHECAAVKIEAFSGGQKIDESTLSAADGLLSASFISPIDYIIVSQGIMPRPPFGKDPFVKDPIVKNPGGIIVKQPKTDIGIHKIDLEVPLRRSTGITFYKICTGTEYIEHGKHVYYAFRKMKERPDLPAKPEGLRASAMPGITRTLDNGAVEDRRCIAGLKWDIPIGADGKLPGHSPVMYHIKRRPDGGREELITRNSPVIVSGKLVKSEQSGEELYYTDAAPEMGKYFYSIAAIDIWGRISNYCNWVDVELMKSLPPPPAGIEAKYLDPEDKYLTGSEKAEVARNGNRPLLKVRWVWAENLKRQAPDITAFKIHFQPGWLNVICGRIDSQAVENGSILELKTNYINAEIINENAFEGEKLQMNMTSFDILSSRRDTDGKFIFCIAKPTPAEGEHFSIPLSQNSTAFKNYGNSGNWERELYYQNVIPGAEQYEVFISNPPMYPDINDKMVYGQIGIGSVNSIGEGPVSSPAALIALYREKPPAQEIKDMPGEYATPANYHGKSSFALRWSRNSELLYFVYRTMDESLFATDRNERAEAVRNGVTRVADAESFIHNLGLDTYKDEIKQKILNPAAIDYKAVLRDAHKNVLLKALANIPGNEKAFTKLNDKAISGKDAAYNNRRNYWEPENLNIDSSLMLYVDDTLDGKAENLYFYRIRSVNEINTQSDFGPATYPVYLKKTALSASPIITRIEGGDRQITVKWSPVFETGIAGYLLYRTDSEAYVRDIRRMKVIKNDPSDDYSVVQSQEPTFIDNSIEPYKKYFYRVVAVAVLNENNTTHQIKSSPSQYAAGMAFDDTIPGPPPITDIEWVLIDQNGVIHPFGSVIPAGESWQSAVRLSWTLQDTQTACLVQYRGSPGDSFANASDWLSGGASEYMHKNRNWRQEHEYRIKVTDRYGKMNTSYLPVTLPAAGT